MYYVGGNYNLPHIPNAKDKFSLILHLPVCVTIRSNANLAMRKNLDAEYLDQNGVIHYLTEAIFFYGGYLNISFDRNFKKHSI